MTGILTKIIDTWMVKYDNDGNIKFYELCPQTKSLIQNQIDIKQDSEVIFDFIITGEYCGEKKTLIKKYFAKIKKIEHQSL